MNKQQLATRIWKSANKMRSKIEASEYKDFILGFIFYKFLSDQEIAFLKSQRWDDEDIASLSEDDARDVNLVKRNKGYFISYENLYSTWLSKGTDFNIANVRDALSAFERNIHPDYKLVFDGIFNTLATGLSKLGENASSQTKAVADLLELIEPIPTDGKQGYDVLGFIYEYLLMQFATNSGKKAGQFYTPHEVAIVMSDIIANHLKESPTIDIYDPTSGSASLLLTIGQSVAKKSGNPNSIHYYAQELIGATYNLTRMNLVMRGIQPANIDTRNDDTLGDDWPLESDADKPLLVNACVSNPPYSQPWTYPEGSDPRFADYGLAPKSKADYAFLLHNLYHLKRDGIMCIVLPHGVLFRGGEEAKIRQKLLEDGNIDAVIGLPANIFYGTGIPTIIMVVKKVRENNDVLFIDASRGFVKEGKKNKLRARDIRKIVDAYEQREDIEKFAHVAELSEIEENGYNLNIPRYVSSSDEAETYDLFATVYGGIPSTEIDEYQVYWDVLCGLRETLFEEIDGYGALKVDDIADAISNHPSVQEWLRIYQNAYAGFDIELEQALFADFLNNSAQKLNTDLSAKVLERGKKVPIFDSYGAYQAFDDHWQQVGADIEAVQNGGMEALRAVDANMVIKEEDGKEKEVQDKKTPWLGRVIPFDLVQRRKFSNDLEDIAELQRCIAENNAELDSILQSLSPEELEGEYCDENGEKWVFGALAAAIDKVLMTENDEYAELKKYIAFLDKKPSKAEKLEYVNSHPHVSWNAIETNNDGTRGKAKVNAYIKELQTIVPEGEEALSGKLIRANKLNEDNKALEKERKEKTANLILETKAYIEQLDDQEALDLVREKWIEQLMLKLDEMPRRMLSEFAQKVTELATKYDITLTDVDEALDAEEAGLIELLKMLEGDASDLEGISGLIHVLGGDKA